MARPLTAEAADDQLRRTQLDEAWNACSKLLTHTYLDAKRIPGMHARLHKSGAIAVPIRNRCGQLEGIQMISADGNKRNIPGTRKVGFGLLLGKNAADKTLQVVEGWATGVTVHLLLEKPVVVAFGCDNLLAAAQHFRIEEQPVRICGDNDSDGTGQAAAERAAQALGPRAYICIPPRPGDWNDMYCAYLLRRLDSATAPARSSQHWRAAA